MFMKDWQNNGFSPKGFPIGGVQDSLARVDADPQLYRSREGLGTYARNCVGKNN